MSVGVTVRGRESGGYGQSKGVYYDEREGWGFRARRVCITVREGGWGLWAVRRRGDKRCGEYDSQKALRAFFHFVRALRFAHFACAFLGVSMGT